MKWSIWDKIEKILDAYNIKPIVAVIPNNKDPKILMEESNLNFWLRVLSWQKKGYSIAIHGYEHRYITQSGGLLKIGEKSEFAGLSYKEQSEKIVRAVEIFKNNSITPDLWIAPSHTFDNSTIKVLIDNNINLLSDGFFRGPCRDKVGMVWIPSQLWDRIKDKHSGLWTVCYHPNNWDDNMLQAFEKDICSNLNRIVSLDSINLDSVKNLSVFDSIRNYYGIFKINFCKKLNSFNRISTKKS